MKQVSKIKSLSNVLKSNLAENRTTASILFIFSIVLICLTFTASLYVGIPLEAFYRDPNAYAPQPFYVGVMSNLGAVCMLSAAAILLFSAYVRKPLGEEGRSLLFASTVLALLGGDDLFMFHDGLAPHIGVPQWSVYLAYQLIVSTWVLLYYRIITAGPWTLALVGYGFLCLSGLVDISSEKDWIDENFFGRIALEDGAKFLGFLFWSAYGVGASWSHVCVDRPR